jgi:hypothetical protein
MIVKRKNLKYQEQYLNTTPLIRASIRIVPAALRALAGLVAAPIDRGPRTARSPAQFSGVRGHAAPRLENLHAVITYHRQHP